MDFTVASYAVWRADETSAKPDVSFMGMVSTAGAERAIRIGRACTEAAIPAIEALLSE